MNKTKVPKGKQATSRCILVTLIYYQSEEFWFKRWIQNVTANKVDPTTRDIHTNCLLIFLHRTGPSLLGQPLWALAAVVQDELIVSSELFSNEHGSLAVIHALNAFEALTSTCTAQTGEQTELTGVRRHLR